MKNETVQKNIDSYDLINSPTLGLKEMAGTIMNELVEKNEKVKEVVVHVRVVRLPGGLKTKAKHCKAKVSTVSYKFNVNQAVLHKMLARKRQQQQRLHAQWHSSKINTSTATTSIVTASNTTASSTVNGCVTSQDPDTEIKSPLMKSVASNINHPATPSDLPAVSVTQLPLIHITSVLKVPPSVDDLALRTRPK